MQRCQILRVFDTCADDLGESGEEVEAGGRELIAADESAVIAKLVPDASVVKDGESNRGLSDSPYTDEGEGLKVFCEPDNLFDQCVPTETGTG